MYVPLHIHKLLSETLYSESYSRIRIGVDWEYESVLVVCCHSLFADILISYSEAKLKTVLFY
jgi:hypothetical protein